MNKSIYNKIAIDGDHSFFSSAFRKRLKLGKVLLNFGALIGGNSNPTGV